MVGSFYLVNPSNITTFALQGPEKKGSVLREEATWISYKAEAILPGQVWQAFDALE